MNRAIEAANRPRCNVNLGCGTIRLSLAAAHVIRFAVRPCMK